MASRARDEDDPIASDGLVARDNGAWGRDKLDFLDNYVPTALDATLVKIQRVYVDLFAGPGRNVERGTGTEFDGSPIRVLSMHGKARPDVRFTHAYFVNKEPAHHAALSTRIDRAYAAGRALIPQANVEARLGDANHECARLLGRVNTRAYVLVFADITRPKHWPWRTVERLKSLGHESLELYMLFPLGMAIQRLIGFMNPEHTEKCALALTRFFGTEEWRELADRRITDAQSLELRRGLEQLYVRQLRALWTYADAVKDVKLRGDQSLYRMLFASDHEAGLRIADWAKRRERGGQLGLGF